jgi:osmotically-inducible protein OsmY
MVLRFQTSDDHGDCCGIGHSLASTRASVESALSAAPDLDSTEITVTILGSYVVLEGFVRARDDIARATDIAEDVVGKGQVQARMLRR